MSNPEVPPEITAELDAMLERMQTPEHKAAIDRMFNMSPEEIQSILQGTRDKATGSNPDQEV